MEQLLDERDWWRRVDDEQHGVLCDYMHELSDEGARCVEYLALLCGALAHDRGLSPQDLEGMINGLAKAVYSELLAEHVAPLIRAAYQTVS